MSSTQKQDCHSSYLSSYITEDILGKTKITLCCHEEKTSFLEKKLWAFLQPDMNMSIKHCEKCGFFCKLKVKYVFNRYTESFKTILKRSKDIIYRKIPDSRQGIFVSTLRQRMTHSLTTLPKFSKCVR